MADTDDRRPATDPSAPLRAGDRQAADDGMQHTTTQRMADLGIGAADQPFSDLAAANAEVRRLRDENANRRVSNRSLQEQIDELKKQVPTADVQQQIGELQGQPARYQAAGEAGISPELRRASEELGAARTVDEMRAATEKIQRLTAQPAPSQPRNPAPPRQPTQPPSLDGQIQAAQNQSNVREAMRLKTQKLTESS